MKANVGNGCNNRLVKLALQPLLYYFHVQQAKKTATETKAQCLRCFQLVSQGGIVQLQLVHAVAQLFKVLGIYRERYRQIPSVLLLQNP